MTMAEMPRQPVFVVLEGLRGCGKSTVAPLLARALGAVQVPTFPAEFGQARAFLDWHSRNADARAHLFIAALLVTADRAKALLDTGTPVVIDSFAQRTLAMHRAFGATLDWEPPASMPVPVTFLLTCSPAERQRRLLTRAKPATRWDELADRLADKIQRQYARFLSHSIDTSGHRPEETAAEIASLVMTHNCTARCRRNEPALGD
jgi:thymidylate kinase